MRFAAIRSLLAFLSLLLATAVLTVSAPSVAGAATASLAKGRAAYAYDTPPLISAPIARSRLASSGAAPSHETAMLAG